MDDIADANGNRIVGTKPESLRVHFEPGAKNCTLRLGNNVQSGSLIQFRAPGGEITLGDNTRISAHIMIGTGKILIGARTYIGPNSEISTAEDAVLSIGAGCLLGAYNIIRSDDAHPFYDQMTGERLNRARNTTIGDGVWTGRNVALMPGSHVHEGSVIGAMSVVTASRPVPAHTVAVGNPAHVVRRNVEWLYKHVQLNPIPESIEPTMPPDPLPRRNWLRAVARRVRS